MEAKKDTTGGGRRKFLAASAAFVAGCALSATRLRGAVREKLTAGKLNEYLNSLGAEWMDPARTVDTFKAGSPDAVVTGIAVAWMSYTGALRKALGLGCNLFITHEPTYYNHTDTDEKIFGYEGAREKKRFIEESGITIIRCHDMWDQYPKIGIPSAWGKFLELGEPVEGKGYYYIYDGKGKTAGEIARSISQKTAAFGQPWIQFIGPESKKINRIILGTGAITPLFVYLKEYNADLYICTDDGFTYWREGAYAADNDLPVVLVNHTVSENWGMKFLADHLRQRFPEVPVRFISQDCVYRLIRG